MVESPYIPQCQQTQQEPIFTYILIRSDIALADQLVQAAHVALEAGKQFIQPDISCHMAVLSVKNQEHLLKAVSDAQLKGIQMTVFHEPDCADGTDYSMGYTAAASQPITGEQRRIFKKYQLWKPKIS